MRQHNFAGKGINYLKLQYSNQFHEILWRGVMTASRSVNILFIIIFLAHPVHCSVQIWKNKNLQKVGASWIGSPTTLAQCQCVTVTATTGGAVAVKKKTKRGTRSAAGRSKLLQRFTVVKTKIRTETKGSQSGQKQGQTGTKYSHWTLWFWKCQLGLRYYSMMPQAQLVQVATRLRTHTLVDEDLIL